MKKVFVNEADFQHMKKKYEGYCRAKNENHRDVESLSRNGFRFVHNIK